MLSVKVAWSITCKSTLNTSGWAFSISSSSTTLYGWARTASTSNPPCSKPTYPGGAPISRATACFSMYSLMSKRVNSLPRWRASCLASSVLPTPVGPVKRKQPAGRSGMPSPARARLIAWLTLRTASSWANTTRCSDSSSVRSRSASEAVACFSGIRAIRAMTRSMSTTSTTRSPLSGGSTRSRAPASSRTSMALSGSR